MSMVKPLFEKDGYKPVDKKFAPKPTPAPVKESRLKVRIGLRLKDADGRTVGFEGEHIFMPRKTLMRSRDKLACAGSSSHTRKFAVSNGYVDSRMDAAGVSPPCLTPPAPRRAIKRSRASHRSLASSI